MIYGPFHDNGQLTSESNAAFDASLKARDPPHGYPRRRQAVDALAARPPASCLVEDRAMPANNRCRIWRRDPS